MGDAMGGAKDTDDEVWVDSTVNEVSTRECREGGSLFAAIAAPAGREGELPFTLQVRGWRLKPALSDRITSAVLNCTSGAAKGTDVGWDEERRGYWAADETEGDLPSLLLGLTHLTASKLAGGRQQS